MQSPPPSGKAAVVIRRKWIRSFSLYRPLNLLGYSARAGSRKVCTLYLHLTSASLCVLIIECVIALFVSSMWWSNFVDRLAALRD
jgi:hypothetical protein